MLRAYESGLRPRAQKLRLLRRNMNFRQFEAFVTAALLSGFAAKTTAYYGMGHDPRPVYGYTHKQRTIELFSYHPEHATVTLYPRRCLKRIDEMFPATPKE
jgi:hypothetical protein